MFLCVVSPVLLAQQDHIPNEMDRDSRVVLNGNVHPQARDQYDRGPVDPSLRLPYMTLVLKNSPTQQVALNELLRKQQDPSSPLFHQWLTPEQYADRFGLSSNAVANIVSWLQAAGLTVLRVARGRDFIVFSGTATVVENAFQTSIHYYQVGGKTHYANATAPAIPATFAGIVTAIFGLDDFNPERPRNRGGSLKRRAVSDSTRPDLFVPPGFNLLAPGDLATLYDIAPLYESGFDGTGQTVVVIGRTNVDFSDIRTFRQVFGLAPNDPQVILVPGSSDPGIVADQVLEADLDLEITGAVARNATIIFVYSANVIDSVIYAIDSNLAPVISYSFGSCEQNITPLVAQAIESLARQANSEGITWIASSGDSGAAACEDQNGAETSATTGMWVALPASLPEVTSVGGTEFDEGTGTYWIMTDDSNGGSALGYIPEAAWNDSPLLKQGLAASGGGASTIFAKPHWQVGPGVPNDGQRDVPDIALSASGLHDPYVIWSTAQPILVGGTSAAAPVFAGIVVLLNHCLTATGAQPQAGLGNINPNLYKLAQVAPIAFHDITRGNNIVSCTIGSPNCSTGSFGYNAGRGYDQVTGLGSVDAYNLVTNWTLGGQLPSLMVTSVISDTAATAGGPIGVSILVLNQGPADAGPFHIGADLSTSANLSSGELPFAFCDIQALSAGASARCSGTVNVPSSIQPGVYYFIGVADVFHELVQSDRSQNVRVSDSGPVTITN
ncbi:MAG TPA: protease pro-enzyme activation domain-containing protein [Bryobacteraceae bacterium]|nr:protease pro-enzyme activation domain-containing protein [Bryobacteraceae bacterium]